jgi:F-type H+-transporting ATPase subunit b
MRRRGRLRTLAWTVAGGAGPVLLPAVAAAAGGDEPGIINLNVTLLIQAINFLILIALLSRFLWKPLTRFLGQRAEGIQKALTEAQAARDAAARSQDEYAAQILATQRETAAIREQARRDVETERQRLLQASRAEAQRLVADAQAAIQAETKRAKLELRAEAVTLSLAAAERLLGRAITAEDQKRLVEQYVRDLGGGN